MRTRLGIARREPRSDILRGGVIGEVGALALAMIWTSPAFAIDPADFSHYELYVQKPGVREAHDILQSRLGPVANFVGADLTCSSSDGNWTANIPLEFTQKGLVVSFQRHRSSTPGPNAIDIVLLVDIDTAMPHGIGTGGTLASSTFKVTEQDNRELTLVGGGIGHQQTVTFLQSGQTLQVAMNELSTSGSKRIADLVCTPSPGRS